MTRLVVFDTKNHTYRIFEGKKCITEFVCENKEYVAPAVIEEMRTGNYTVA